jgi:hypothetical protein
MPVKHCLFIPGGWLEVYCDFEMVAYCRYMKGSKVLTGWKADVARWLVSRFGFAN